MGEMALLSDGVSGVSWQWVLSHVGVPGNEGANRQEIKGADKVLLKVKQAFFLDFFLEHVQRRRISPRPHPPLPLPLGTLRCQTRLHLL